MNRITKATAIEDLVSAHPAAAALLVKRGLPCLVCGEPIWGTLEEAARRGGYVDEAIDRLVEELNADLKER